MSNRDEKDFDVEKVLSDLFKPAAVVNNETLFDVFERRLTELSISRTAALDILKIERVTLVGILEGKQRRADFSNFLKLSHFLKIKPDEVISLYLKELVKNFPEYNNGSQRNVEFIKANFDLAVLKKCGFIKSITDFDSIEKRIVKHFGLSTIYDYKRPSRSVAFSSGIVATKNELTRDFWLNNAEEAFKQLNNPYDFDRKLLIDYFPQIRWHSTNVEKGLLNVIKDLFQLGITVIYLPSLSDLHLRGATIQYNGKPCIVLSNYKGFYPTLWFALIHELFHVIFDWDEIKSGSYHFSEEDPDRLTLQEKENEANNFAREYLFSVEKMKKVKRYLSNDNFIYEFANQNHVHPSFIYVFYASELKDNRAAWSKARKHNPDEQFKKLISAIENNWNAATPVTEYFKVKKYKYYY